MLHKYEHNHWFFIRLLRHSFFTPRNDKHGGVIANDSEAISKFLNDLRTYSVRIIMIQDNKYKIEQKVIEILKAVFDPEIPVNIYDLGLIYNIKVDTNGKVDIEMTLTSPNCPVAESLPIEIEKKVSSIEGVTDVHIEIVWDPPWNYYMMSDAAKLELGML